MSKATLDAWKPVTVRDLVEKHFCGPSPDCEERQVFKSDEWGVLKTTAITWSGWDESAHKVLPKAYWNQPDIEVHSGDVLVTKAGPRHRVAVVCHVPSTRNQLVVSGKMIGLRPKVGVVESAVLAGLIARQAPQKYIQDRTTGMAESQVNFANEVLLNTPLNLPPPGEQRVIAQISEQLDTAIHETEAIIAKLKAIKQGLLHDLLTRGIDANGELRPPQAEAPHLYKESPQGWIPKEWSSKKLGQILSEPTKNGLYKPAQFHGRGPLMVQMGGLFAGDAATFDTATRVHVTPFEFNTFGLSVGDLLFARRSLVFEGAGQCVIVRNLPEPATFESSIVRVRVRKEEADPEFVCQYLRSYKSYVQRRTLIRQVAVSGVSGADIRELLITLPSPEEQGWLVARQLEVQALIDLEMMSVAKLRNQKSGLMDDLLNGRVRVTPLLAEAAKQNGSA